MTSTIAALPLPEGTGAVVSLLTNGQSAGAVQMTTAEIEEAIGYLAALRAELKPEIDRNPYADREYITTEDAHVTVINAKQGDYVVFTVLNIGFGWLAFGLESEHARSVGAELIRVSDDKPRDRAPTH